MLKFGGAPAGWQDYVMGARVRFAPIGPKAVRRARIACAAALRVDVADIEEAGDALSRELIRRGIVEWEGIGDADGEAFAPDTMVPVIDDAGKPVIGADGEPVMQAAVELFLADPTAFEWADRVYVQPWTEREREKNGWSPSPNGTSAGAMPEADTASSAAPPEPESGATAAPIASTSRKPRRPRKSGKS